MKTKRLSPFSKEFWIAKGYTESDAEYKRNSIRPIRKEYWLEKGYTEEEAIRKAIEVKDSNNKKGARKSGDRNIEEIRKVSKRCKEYWLEKGYTEEEAVIEVGKVQRTFSLDICIEKYGLEEGTKRWMERQESWQNTLKSKSKKEIENINKNKNCLDLKHFSSIEECIDSLSKCRNMKLFSTIEDYIEHIKSEMEINPHLTYYPLDKFIPSIPNIQLQIFEKLGIGKNEFVDKISHLFKSSKGHEVYKEGTQSYRKWTSEGLLRSSYEIYFYDKIKELYPNIEFELDGNYPESSMRFDFKIGSIYIEICPKFNVDEKYRLKMLKKKELFGCVLLKTIADIDNFFIELQG